MVARLLISRMVLGLLFLAPLGLSPLSAAQAAVSGGAGSIVQSKRPLFRPEHGVPAAHAQRNRGGLVIAAPRQSSPAGRQRARGPVFEDGRAGARKAVPVTRGQELGLRFRPDEGESPYGQVISPQSGPSRESYSTDLQSQFRPTEKRRKRTYEETQPEELQPPPMMAPLMPYPMLPPPLPGYGPGWR